MKDAIYRRDVDCKVDEILKETRGTEVWLYLWLKLKEFKSLPSIYSPEQVQKMQDIEQVMLDTAYECGRSEATELNSENVKPDPMGLFKRCNKCKHYEGVHDVQGTAPCTLWNEQVLWNWGCAKTIREKLMYAREKDDQR